MKRLLAFLFGCACLEAKTESIVTDAFLDKVAMIESNFNYEAVGDKGKAIGAWQMHEPAWREACLWVFRRDALGSHCWQNIADDHKASAKDPIISRLIARSYFKILEEQMRRNSVEVTPIKLYMAWNMGYAGANKFRFDCKSYYLDPKRLSILARANHILSR